MLAVEKIRCRKHCPSRFLQDQIGEASSIPVPDLREDLLLEHRYALYRLQHRRTTFDEVATLSVEGMSKSAIARVKGIAWNTVHRWLERAAAWCRRFNNRTIKGLSVAELQADEIKTIVGSKEQPMWIFAVIECGLGFGLHSGRQTELPKHAHPLSKRFQSNESRTDSPDRHGWIRILRESRSDESLGQRGVYGQVIKTRRNDRIVKVELRWCLGMGGDWNRRA